MLGTRLATASALACAIWSTGCSDRSSVIAGVDPLIAYSGICTEQYHGNWADGPPSWDLSSTECASIQGVVSSLGSHSSSFCQGVGEWAGYYFNTGRFSRWNHVSSHNHEGQDIIALHGDAFASPDDLVEHITHEVMHNPDWGISHDTSPSNFDLDTCCTSGCSVPPPPPPEAPSY
jgi:hypothetical protein